jgi:hypothetical protein
MKNLLALFTLFITTSLYAQITLEHEYPKEDNNVRLLQLDSNEFKYIVSNGNDTISVFNLDHSLYKLLIIPKVNGAVEYYGLCVISRRLFDIDDQLEYMVLGAYDGSNPLTSFLRVLNENNVQLFRCDSCFLVDYGTSGIINLPGVINASIVNTETGTKMLIRSFKAITTQIYSLPGKFFGGKTTLGIDQPNIISSTNISLTSYPNPSSGEIRIEYKLPEGATTGEIVITTTDGKEVKRYKVGNVFNDILIERSELRSGAYFYKLVTPRGASEAKKFIIAE